MIYLFPGQGSQKPGMGRDFHAAGGAGRAVLDAAARYLPNDFLATLFEGDAAALRPTRTAQPALLVAELAAAAHLRERGIAPSACAGHSLGEHVPDAGLHGARRGNVQHHLLQTGRY